MNAPIQRRTILAGLSATLLPIPSARAQPEGGTSPLLLAAPAKARWLPEGPDTEVWRFGERPPVLRVRHGETLRAQLRNETPRPLSLHGHGVRGPNGQDGVGGLTQDPVAPGGSADLRLTPPDPGTFLLRPLVLGGSSEPAARGLVALLVVDEPTPPATDGDHVLLVRDWLVTESGTFPPFGDPREAALGGRLGNRLHVEGDAAPRRLAVAPGARLRVRFVNGCNARVMRIRFDGLRAYVISVDGQPTDTFEPLRATLPFAPGNRYDIMLDAPADDGGRASITALIGTGLPLVEIVSEGAATGGRPPIAPLPPNPRLPPEIKLQNAVRKTVSITGGASRDGAGAISFPPDAKAIWRMNGSPGSTSGPPLVVARRGQPVVLGISNNTGFLQVLHLHGHAFRLLHPLDDGWEPYFLDTVQIPEGKTIQIAFLADNPGRWLLGSAVLERLDTGLWTWFEVV